jgi:hypothetical protein
MGIIASGISKVLTFKKQTGLGVIASGSGQNLRRTTSTLDKKKATYASKEIRPSQQRSDFRHGVVSVDGTISGELSVGTYQAFTESICRQLAQVPVTFTGAVSDIVSAATTGASGTLTATAANFLTQGFKVGLVIRCTGFTTTGVSNNALNMLITAINAAGKIMTVTTLNGSAIANKVETAALTLTTVGKHTYMPQTGQTRDYYSIEHNFADIVQSEVFTDCVVTQMNVKLPATGIAGIDFAMKGLNMKTNSDAVGPIATPYFTANSVITTGSTLTAANGVMYLNGAPIGLITGLNFSIKGNHTLIGGVVGTNAEPDVFPGDMTADGQVTVLFQDNVVRDIFLNETEVAIIGVFTTDSTAASGFVSYTFPRCKMGGAAKDDGEKGLVMTMPFTALENVAGGALLAGFQTTFMVQDSAFV